MAQKKKGIISPAAARRRRRKAAQVIETRAKKEFTYRGKTMQELLELDFEKQVALLPSRARRSIGRGFTPEQVKIMNRIRTVKPGTPIRTHRREMVIVPEMVGHSFHVYSGSEFRPMTVMPEMIGHVLGEFVLTRKTVSHGGVGVGATRGSKHLPLK